MNTPNKLTILRILLIPIFLWFMYAEFFRNIYFGINLGFGELIFDLALAIFVIASITDWLDGYLARKNKQITTFGKFADPLADKLLVAAALVAFVDFGYINGIIAIIVISREFIVTGLRLVAISENRVIAAGFWGKIKTILQIATIIAILLVNDPVTISAVATDHSVFLISLLVDWLAIIMTAVTVISGIEYVWKNRKLIKVD